MIKKVLLPIITVLTVIVLMGCPTIEIPQPEPVALPDATINVLDIEGVTAPVTGATPITTITETSQYTGTVTWNGAPANFAASTAYTATITLSPKAGYVLTGLAENSFKVAGATATNSAGSGVITAVFPDTKEIVINITDIPGVTLPVLGATPVTTITETAQYTGTVTWDGSPTIFAASTTYTATITLNPKAGYTLSGVEGFDVPGANSISFSSDSNIVTAEFPPTLSFSLTMIKVPAGKFQRDATATNISVITQSYKMSAHEITRTQFAAIFTVDPSATTASSGKSDPVQMLNWYHAIAFCNKLSLAEGLTPVYTVIGVDFSTLTYADIPKAGDNATWNAATATWTNNGYRLPSEMEWMWAAMGAPADGQSGGTNTTGYTKAFAGSTGSNAIGDYAVFGNYGSETGKTTSARSNPVGSKGANELGLYDMSGNVWEWCWDWYASYISGTLTDYLGAASGTSRIKRGGAWNGNGTDCRVASRSFFNPLTWNSNYGFRVVRN